MVNKNLNKINGYVPGRTESIYTKMIKKSLKTYNDTLLEYFKLCTQCAK